MPKSLRVLLVAAGCSLGGLTFVGCGTATTATGSAPATTVAAGATPVASNDLLPTNGNLSDCVGLVERPNCGSTRRGDSHMYMTLAAMTAGMTLIGWRIVVGARKQRPAQRPPTTTF